MLAASCTVPLTLLMGVGAVTALRRGGRTELLHGMWVAAHLIFVCVITSHKEIRYLLPALPSLVFFALWHNRHILGRKAEGDAFDALDQN